MGESAYSKPTGTNSLSLFRNCGPKTSALAERRSHRRLGNS